MDVKNIDVKISNNLNAIVKGGTNVNAVVTLKPKDAMPHTTPEIAGGRGNGPFTLEYNPHKLELVISVYANNLGPAERIVIIPLNADTLSIDLEGTHNGKIDIQTSFK